MNRKVVFRPKMTEEQRRIVLRALRLYLVELIKDLDKKRPIGLDKKAEVDRLEEALLIYGRFKTIKTGRSYPYWWSTTYDYRLRQVYEELREDERQEQRQAEEKAKSPPE